MKIIDKRSCPLKKVIKREFNFSGERKGSHDYLECGHILRTPSDIIGEYYPLKRRCYKCAKGNEKEF